jgi:hypothetical protein
LGMLLKLTFRSWCVPCLARSKDQRAIADHPTRQIIGTQTGGLPLSEAEHSWKCEACGGWFDMRDLGARCWTMKNRCRIRRAIRCNSSKISPRFPEGRSLTARGVHPASAAIVVSIVMALLRLIRVKCSLLDLRLLYQFSDPTEQRLIRESGRQTMVMLDLLVEFDAPVTHSISPFF